jgi:hypothetical protein
MGEDIRGQFISMASAKSARAKRAVPFYMQTKCRKSWYINDLAVDPSDSVRKNSGFDFVLKGRGFSRAVSAATSTPALAAEDTLSQATPLSPQPAKH